VSSRLRGIRGSRPWRLYAEDTEQMYSKHLSVKSNFRQTVQYCIKPQYFHTPVYRMSA